MTSIAPPTSIASRMLRHPLLHFTLLGTLLYLAFGTREPMPVTEVVVRTSDLATLRADWLQMTGREPNARERERLIELFVGDSLLVREARALGWDRSDSVVQQRLIRNLRFLGESEDGRPTSEMSDPELLAMAFEMEMEKSDIVVRRRLLGRMKLAIAARARSQEPTDAELSAHLADHAADFERPSRTRLSHVFLSRDRRGTNLNEDALAMLETLRAAEVPPIEAAQHGDPLLIGADLPLWSEREIAERLGADFARGVQTLPTEDWSGPVYSSYGAHLVWVHEHDAARPPTLEEARRELRAAVLHQRETAALHEAVKTLREGVSVRIERDGS